MNIYLITRIDVVGRDEMASCVVSAATEADALNFAMSIARDEDPLVWTSTDVVISKVGTALSELPALICQDVHNA